MKWLDMFTESVCNWIPQGILDHFPGVIKLLDRPVYKGYLFKFYNIWVQYDGYKELITNALKFNCIGSEMYKLWCKLGQVKRALKSLHRN